MCLKLNNKGFYSPINDKCQGLIIGFSEKIQRK